MAAATWHMAAARVCVCFILLVLLHFTNAAPSKTSSQDNDVLRFRLSTQPGVDAERTCKSRVHLSPAQLIICQRQPHATAAALDGINMALTECQKQMAGHRWNCSDLKDRNTISYPITKRGFRESAFVQAVMAAGVVHHVATSCANGGMKMCGCDGAERPVTDGEWQWGGCSHDVNFGNKFSRRFLQVKGSDLHATVSGHNGKVGRKVVADNLTMKCKCLGMSSSCEMKTCWMAVSEFSAVGRQLHDLYDQAIMVDSTNDVTGRVTPRTVQPPSPAGARSRSMEAPAGPEASGSEAVTSELLGRSLLYYERSPTYCDADQSLGVAGTSGRPCDTASDGPAGCQKLCCGRGYFTVKVRRSEKCNCRFHWCCNVTCERCVNSTWITVCK